MGHLVLSPVPDEMPNSNQWMERKDLLKNHPAKWTIREDEPMQTSADNLKPAGVSSLVFAPCGNVPAQGDFLSIMHQNVESLKAAFHS